MASIKFDSINTVPKKFTKEDALRQGLIDITNNDKCPLNIFEIGTFEVKEIQIPVAVIAYDVTIDYSCSIGYDREEIYYEKEKRHNSSTNSYEMVDVKKTRTVTDWSPYKGTNSSSETEILIVDDQLREKLLKSSGMASTLISDFVMNQVGLFTEIKEIDVPSPTAKLFKDAEISAGWGAFYSANIPGDRKKDEDWNGDFKQTATHCVIITGYVVTAKYGGKETQRTYLSLDSISSVSWGEFPEAPFGTIEVVENEMKSKAKMKLLPHLILGFALMVVGVIVGMSVINTFLAQEADGFWHTHDTLFGLVVVLSFAMPIVGIVVLVKRHKKWVPELYERLVSQELTNKKKNGLISTLSKKGLSPLKSGDLKA